MIWDEAHREAMFAAAQLHDDLRIDCTRRIDVYRALQGLNIRVLFRPLRGCAGMYLPSSGGAAGILLHADHPTRLQRYTAAHELGHHVFGHGEATDLTASILRSSAATLDPNEKLAEAFAAWFLMPPELVDEVLSMMRVRSPLGAVDIYELALRLGTSYRATCIHLRSLKLLTAAEVQRALAVQPRSIKERIAPRDPRKTWRHDVWLVTSGSDGELLSVSAGDRVLFHHGASVPRPHANLFDEGAGVAETDSCRAEGDWFDVPAVTHRAKWDLDFFDGSTGATRVAVELEVTPPITGLLSEEFSSSLVPTRRARIAI